MASTGAGRDFRRAETGRLQMIRQLRAVDFVYDSHFGGIPRTDDLVLIQVTAAPRPPEQRRAFFGRTAELLAAAALKRRNLVISLIDGPRENWFFGPETATDAIEKTAP
jgi:4-oxalocrotonate tautomerase